MRSHAKGWVFCREGVNPPQVVLDQALLAVKALGLDFSAVDVIYNESENKAYILECNSAMGIEENSTSLTRYTNAFKKVLNNALPDQFEVIGEAPANPIPVVEHNVPALRLQPVRQNAPQPIVTAPIVAPVANQNRYSLDGITNVVIKFVDNVTKIFGHIAGINHQIKVMEITNGVVTFWWAEQDND